jgi:exosortase
MSRIETASPLTKPKVSAVDLGQLRSAAIGSGILMLAHLPLLIHYTTHMWHKPHYQFFPLVPLGAAVIAMSRLRGVTLVTPGSQGVSYALLAGSFVLLSLGVLSSSPWLGAVSFLITLAAMIIAIGGRDLARRLFVAWGLLWLAVPPPLDLDLRLITSLQRFTARAGSAILDIWPFQVLHQMSGTIVEVPGKSLLVEEACSGIHSLFAGLACTVFFVFWARRRWIRGTLLVLAAVLWVLAANVTRVVVITYAYTKWDINLAEGVTHTAFGLVLFAITLSLIISTDRFLLFLTPRKFVFRAAEDDKARGIQDEAPLPNLSALPDLRSTALGGFPVALAFGLVLAFQVWALSGGVAKAEIAEPDIPFTDRELGPDALPLEWGVWRRSPSAYRVERRKRSDPDGAFSQSWEYHSGDMTAIASLDLPFRGWHDLTICYRNIGWTQVDRRFHDSTEVGVGPFVEVELAQQDEQNGYLLFGLHDEAGRPMQPLNTLWNRLGSRLKAGNLWRGSQQVFYSDADQKSFQVQLIVQCERPLRQSEREDARQFYHFLRNELARNWVEAIGGESR